MASLPPNEGHVYQTINGMRTVAQMRTELKAAGYPNWQSDNEKALVAAYAHTAGGKATLGMAPMPYQINPMVWDSMSNTAKKLFLSMAQAGQTKTGVWEPEDYLNQFEQSRPKGTAPKQVSYGYDLNRGSYF